MINVAELKPTETFAQGAEFVRIFGGEEMAAINPVEAPMVYAEAVASLNPRRPTAEEKALAQQEGAEAELIRHQLVEKRKSWGKGNEAVVDTAAEAMRLKNTENAFTVQPDSNPTVYSHITAIEGANDQTYLRGRYPLVAQKAGLITVKSLTVTGTQRRAGEKETFGGQGGYQIADRAIARLTAEMPELFYGDEGNIAVRALRVRTGRANTRDTLRESWLQASPADLSDGRVGVSTSAIYGTFMGHDAGAVALELGVPAANIDVSGLPAPAGTARNVASYGAEISQALVSAAYHQQAINVRS